MDGLIMQYGLHGNPGSLGLEQYRRMVALALELEERAKEVMRVAYIEATHGRKG